MKLGLIRERKNPPDRRVAFLPSQCTDIQAANPSISFLIEPSDIRCVHDNEYLAQDLEVSTDIEKADILFGIKEIPAANLLPDKTYFFFSHTIKKQAHNQKLLQAALAKKITLVDYECLLDEKGNRTVAFGRFAGIVGAYNALRMWMYRFHQILLKPAFECGDMSEMMDYAQHHVSALEPIKIAITGSGRVGNGAREILKALNIKEVEPDDYLTNRYNYPVFAQLSSRHYLRHPEQETWDETHFRKNPEAYERHFQAFAQSTDLLITCHYWDPASPPLFTREEAAYSDFQIKVISDVTCDLEGSVPTTLRTSTIQNPFYDIDPQTFTEQTAFSAEKNITVCAIDNLPCELPYDSSKAFGEMLASHVIPGLLSGGSKSIEMATIVKNGKLTDRFQYLEDYAFPVVTV